MTARIMIVEDEEPLTLLLRYNLEAEGYAVDTAARGDEAEVKLKEATPDLVVLDWMLPGMSGIELCRRLRARVETERLPIIMLTARGEESERIRGLATGADDYIVKPFSVPELVARIRALLRRALGTPELIGKPRFELGRFWIRFDTGQALTNEGELSLSDKELKLMELFVHNENKPLSRADILEEVWGMGAFPTDRTVDNFVLRLRKLFEEEPDEPVHLITLRGRGYLFRKTP